MKNLILISLMFILFVACVDSKIIVSRSAKPSNSSPLLAKARDMLTDHKFKLTHIYTDMKEEIISDCQLDDTYEFLANGTYIISVNQPCVDFEKDYIWTWTITQSEGKTFLNLNTGAEEGPEEIIRVDNDGFTTTQVYDGGRFTQSFVILR